MDRCKGGCIWRAGDVDPDPTLYFDADPDPIFLFCGSGFMWCGSGVPVLIYFRRINTNEISVSDPHLS